MIAIHREISDEEFEKLIEFAKKHKLDENPPFNNLIQLKWYYYHQPGADYLVEQLYNWFNLREDAYNDYLYIARKIVEEYGKEYLQEANIIDIAGGTLPNLSSNLIKIVPEIKNITVYDPQLLISNEELKLQPNSLSSKLTLVKREFTIDSPLDPNRHTLLISRFPCKGTKTIIDVVGEKKNIDLYTVLCNCDKTKNQGDGITRIRLNTNSPLPWHKEIVYQLQMKRSDVVAITIPERGLEDKRTVIVANSTKQRRNR